MGYSRIWGYFGPTAQETSTRQRPAASAEFSDVFGSIPKAKKTGFVETGVLEKHLEMFFCSDMCLHLSKDLRRKGVSKLIGYFHLLNASNVV